MVHKSFWSGVIALGTDFLLSNGEWLSKGEWRYCVVEEYCNPEEGIFRRTGREMGNFRTKEEAIQWTKAFPIKDRHLSFSIYKYKVQVKKVYQKGMGVSFDYEAEKYITNK